MTEKTTTRRKRPNIARLHRKLEVLGERIGHLMTQRADAEDELAEATKAERERATPTKDPR